MFIDETWTSTNVASTHGRCRRGERPRVGVPHGQWKTTTFVGGLMTRGMIAPLVLDGPVNRNAFETYVERVLSRWNDGFRANSCPSQSEPCTRAFRPIEASKATVQYVRSTSTPAVAGQRSPAGFSLQVGSDCSSGSVCSEGEDRF